MPTDSLLFIVESKDTSAHFVASLRLAAGVTTRSMIGFPYFVSPVWRKGLSRPASMKLP